MPRDIVNFLQSEILILDGAMGTELMKTGIQPGQCGNYLNVQDPDKVRRVHDSYLQAGSDAVITNTFGANKYSLKMHGLSDHVQEINQEGAAVARKAAGEDKFVLGGFGPTGDFLEPLGTLKPDELKAEFAKQAKALENGGADAFIIETMAATDEVAAAVEGIRDVSKLPIIASFAYDFTQNGFRTMMGTSPEQAFRCLKDYDLLAIGFNCGKATLEQYNELARLYQTAVNGKFYLCAEMNAGLPEMEEGRAVYKVSPEEFAKAAKQVAETDVRLIGGCCGTAPEHIKALADNLK